METSTNIDERCFNDSDVWSIRFNNKMSIFNITDDTKTFIKEYIEMNNKDITQWMVSENIMMIFNITDDTLEIFIKYIITKNNELSDKKIKKMDCFMEKSKNQIQPNVQYYELKPVTIKASRLLYTPESYTETEEIMKAYQIRDVDLAETVSMDLTTNVTDETKERFVEFMKMKDKEIMDANLEMLENTNMNI